MNNDKLIEQLVIEIMGMQQELEKLTKENELLREQVTEVTQIAKDSFFYVV